MSIFWYDSYKHFDITNSYVDKTVIPSEDFGIDCHGQRSTVRATTAIACVVANDPLSNELETHKPLTLVRSGHFIKFSLTQKRILTFCYSIECLTRTL
jgi:hypothetical protein